MCTYLNKTSSTYYFRRPVPDDLVGHFRTRRGNPRTEWKRSLGTKDREEAKRLLRPHVTETDTLIDDARAAIRFVPLSPEVEAARRREREEQAAQAALEAASQERRAARSELRTLWRQRRRTSTAMLAPEQAAAVDLINERDAEIEELRRAIAVMQAGNEKLGITGQTSSATVGSGPLAASGAALGLVALFEDYAASGAARPHTVAKWRAAIKAFVAHAGHDDAKAVTRAEVSAWLQSLVEGGLKVKTVTGTYRAALARVLSRAHNVGSIPTNPAANMEVIGPKATKTKRDEISDDEARVILKQR